MSGLQRTLSSGQLSMIAIGGAIGTGLFLGSGFAISLAGPSVLLSYAIGALIALLLMRALAEMTVTDPGTGSFGTLAGRYLGDTAGYLVRYAYWSANVLAVGTEVTAVALYMRFWLPDLPGWWWIAGFSAALIGINAVSVRVFGSVEYLFSSVKIAAILVFLLLGLFTILHPHGADIGPHLYLSAGGFFPHGIGGMWVAAVVSIFSYLGIETIAVAAGEAQDPQRAITRALRSTIARLVFFYLATLAVMLAVMPWTRASSSVSPFVMVMAQSGVPWAASLMNAVILVAALSAMNSQIFAASRMLYGLSEAGQAPKSLSRVTRFGVPLPALLSSSVGIAFAALVFVCAPARAFGAMIAVSIFGALFTWAMIFATHLRFRAVRRAGWSWGSALGLGLMLAILVTTPFTEAFRLTLAYGTPFLAVMAGLRSFGRRRQGSGRQAAPRLGADEAP
ncbi:amino acid permease [Acetobacteraceae bacterium KSS8]|uniref:Amino acid permease n=1 Tax=Endosaccharibacter trunci TaxID=2812733 RepID=A0ABT1W784_9PROT|nr:amino acid permease [Acetobacteraceae bacterium KSS8]